MSPSSVPPRPSSSPLPAVSSAARRAWMAVLARTPRADLEAALQRALQGRPTPAYDWLRPPEIGLAMVRGRIGGSGDPFNLGEATVTRATLRLHASGDAEATVGVACHLGRDRRRAELAALADALLQMPEHHDSLHRRLIEPFAAQQQARGAQQQQDVAATRVEFFTMVRGD
ncbi:alpha-D-ribose 1-methylphosphonate 5-triphosphate synthase subunit PhnG [Paraburkholderia sp. MM5496-R1]|uniref:Alpha-D-ribose 1-methylphosphonate 5-triphosphate synthase subunit PhnG n=1 Tax=Paraburkholderia tuberum TaxID=157910 RepID=A0A1H1K0B1_9BURK|nr:MULTISPECIES: phosphonate C-P lyase system protein PhnG [Paraburkholderia]MBB5408794.1 alpha-D-ribose 1-methylphosphonate 5-triphosphate synthase subunit PhnG [Paraburkholderia sp. HC6.4b]MBB5455419.1 alpha-D-ribose 1-methylphosphonate 5-triphosphate synthase subunit PhnG [Paraburkholderia sp. Kb1A]SDR55676.1 alpha-D-ribose 1-methylphosphonate 5-triphosphate synthase subunit PhnG [Paraburkholderia tuberum]